MPSRHSAERWAEYLVSADRWHLASVSDFRAGLAARRHHLPADQLVWLDHLIDAIDSAYVEKPAKGHVHASLVELIDQFNATLED